VSGQLHVPAALTSEYIGQEAKCVPGMVVLRYSCS